MEHALCNTHCGQRKAAQMCIRDRMIAGLREPAESKEVRLPLSGADFKADGAAVLKRMAQKVQALPGASTAPDNREGIRVNFDAQHGLSLIHISSDALLCSTAPSFSMRATWVLSLIHIWCCRPKMRPAPKAH